MSLGHLSSTFFDILHMVNMTTTHFIVSKKNVKTYAICMVNLLFELIIPRNTSNPSLNIGVMTSLTKILSYAPNKAMLSVVGAIVGYDNDVVMLLLMTILFVMKFLLVMRMIFLNKMIVFEM